MRNNKKFYYKYIHLMYGHDTKFSKLLLDFISNPENGFEIDQHLFVTPYKNVFDDLKQYSNVLLDESNKNLYKVYYKHCHLIISHSGEELYRILLTPKKIKNKVVYRYWGGMRILQYDESSKTCRESLKLKVKKYILKKSFSEFAAIGIANITDIIDLSRILKKDTKYYRLSYGEEKYIQNVENYVKENSKGNIVIMKQFMKFSEYAEFLSTIDIAIFDGYTSYALGNLGIILFFNKTVYLNENGVIAKALESENNDYKKISDIGKLSFEEFSKPMKYPENYTSDLCIISTEERIKNWNKLLADFSDK